MPSSNRASANSADLDKYLRVGMEIEGNQIPIKLHINDDLEEIIEQLCEEHALTYEPDTFSLYVTQTKREGLKTAYVTEDNKFNLMDGEFLKLTLLPKRLVENLAKNLLIPCKRITALTNIAETVSDSLVLKELALQGVLKTVVDIVNGDDCDRREYNSCFKIIDQGFVNGYISSLPGEAIEKVTKVAASSETLPVDTVVYSLRILKHLARSKLLNNAIRYDDIGARIWDLEHPQIQEGALSLLNHLYLCAGSKKQQEEIHSYLSSKAVLGWIQSHVLKNQISSNMKHELFTYQTILLKRYEKEMGRIVMITPQVLEVLKNPQKSKYTADHFKGVDETDGEHGSKEEIHFKRAHTKTLKSFAHDAFDNLKSSFRRKKHRTTSTSDSSDTHAEPISNLRRFLSQQSILVEPIKPSPTFKTYVGDNVVRQSKELFTTSLEFKFGEKIAPNILAKAKNVTEAGNAFKKEKSKSTTALSSYSIDSKKGSKADLPKKTLREAKKSNRKTVPALVLCNILYYAKDDLNSYYRTLESQNRKYVDILNLGEEVTKLLFNVLGIGEKTDDYVETFYRIFFKESDFFLEELFCAVIKMFDVTWKEMRASVPDDRSEVLDVLKEKVILALKNEPDTFKDLGKSLSTIGYDHIARKREEAMKEKMRWDLANKKELIRIRKLITPSIEDLIVKERLAFMIKGVHTPKIERGQKIKKQESFVRLSKTQDAFYVEDCVNNCVHTQVKRILISDIVDVATGKDSNYFKEVAHLAFSERDMFFRGVQRQVKPDDLEFPVSFKLADNTYFDFCARKESLSDCWLDGTDFLLGKTMSSPTFQSEMKDLLDVDVSILYLDLEGVTIPEEPPPVPAEPPNYNFCNSI